MGQTFEVEDAAVATYRDRDAELAQLGGFRVELDEYRQAVANFPNAEPSDILVTLSGVSGRLAEIRADLWRSNTQRATALRTREVDPLRDELDFQFRITSRRIALLEWEFKISGGAV